MYIYDLLRGHTDSVQKRYAMFSVLLYYDFKDERHLVWRTTYLMKVKEGGGTAS